MSEPDIAKEPVSLSQSPGHRSLPFNFAQQQGVLLVDSSDGPHVLTHGQPAVQVLTELRRFLGESYTTECVDSDEFQRRLTVAYQRDNNEAVQMAEDIGADVDRGAIRGWQGGTCRWRSRTGLHALRCRRRVAYPRTVQGKAGCRARLVSSCVHAWLNDPSQIAA